MPSESGRHSSTRSTRAAEYVRMSTEHQNYSTENQADAIRRYASDRGISIVRTYADHGKSGLKLDGRNELKRLIDDVQAATVDFTEVLVYDVSRWGRFQDPDESAYYEYLCKAAGITVHYCAEQFENDGSPSATIIKSVKRAMAGEYSRELSVKVFSGQCRLIGLGFRQGGLAGYGLRRQLIDELRQPKAILAIGAQKHLQTDRVVLVPGPNEEVETVRRMYIQFAEAGQSEREIADALNKENKRTDLGRAWTRGTVHQVLTNEKYIGNNLFNRTSFKLKRKRVDNPPDAWIRAAGVFPFVVDPALFAAVHKIIAARSIHFTDSDMLTRLSDLLKDAGQLSGLVIDERDGMPSSSAYRSRFGSLLRAYTLVGYSPARDYDYVEVNRTLRRMHPQIIGEVLDAAERGGGTIVVDPATDLISVNDEFTAAVVISRCIELPSGSLRWNIRLDTSLRPDITVVVRMEVGNQSALDYYLFPRVAVRPGCLRLREGNGLLLDGFRYDSLDAFVRLACRLPIGSAA